MVKSALEMGKMMKTWLGRKQNGFMDVITVSLTNKYPIIRLKSKWLRECCF